MARCGKYGVCADPYATVLRSELRALVAILRVAVGPLTIHVDSKLVVDGVARGRRWCCDSRREGADLWRQVWDLLDDMPDLIDVVKVRAHLSYQDVLDGRIGWKSWLGNAIADRWAKAGSAAAARQSPVAAVNAQWNRATAWYKWVVTFAGNWVEDTASSGPIPAVERTETGRLPPQAHPSHEIWRNRHEAWCRRCGATGNWGEQGSPPVPLRRSCRGSMADRTKIWGRERAASTANTADDDGVMSFAALRSKGACKVSHTATVPTGSFVGGYVPSRTADNLLRAASAELPPSLTEDDPYDEDPFGFAGLGMDDGDIAHTEPVFDAVPPLPDSSSTRVSRPSARSQSPGAHMSHRLRRTAQAVWCMDCGRFAVERLGAGLLRPCRGKADGGYPSRLRRLADGKRPMTGELL